MPPRRSTRSTVAASSKMPAQEPIVVLDSSPEPPKLAPASPLSVVENKKTPSLAPAAVSVPQAAPAPAAPMRRQYSRFELDELERSHASSSKSPMRSLTTPATATAKVKPAVPVVLQDSEDEDIFDMSKRHVPVVHPHLYSPPSRAQLVLTSDSSSEDEEIKPSAGSHKRKKKRSPLKPSIRIRPEPEWARAGYHEDSGEQEGVAKRGRTGPDSMTHSPQKTKTTAEPQKRAVSLTPPPEIDPAQFAIAKQRVQDHLARSIQVEDELETANNPQRRSASPAKGRIITVQLRMVAGPERTKNPAMARALKDYCKLRTFRVGLQSPLDNMYRTLAERLKKPKDDLVLTYDGQKIVSSLLSPAQLGIEGDCWMEGYEKTTYNALMVEKRQLADDHLARLTQAETEGEDTELQVATLTPPPEEKLMRLVIRDVNGTEIGMKVKDASLCKNMVAHFCKKAGLPESAAVTMRLYVDGEKMDPDSEIGTAGLESGDVIDVR